MKNWKLLCSVCLTVSLLFACGNNTEKDSKESTKTEAFTTENSTSNSNNSNNTDDSSAKKAEVTSVSGQKMTELEQKKLSEFITKYPTVYAKALETGDVTPLTNEYILHETKLYEDLLADISVKNKDGITEKVNKVEISSIKRNSDTDFAVDTIEVIEETKQGKKNKLERHRKYALYYDYVEGDDDNSFFKISEIKETK